MQGWTIKICNKTKNEVTIIPPYLQAGDTIGIVCPSGYMPFEKAQTCIATLQSWGYHVTVGKTLGNQSNYFSGTDEERLQDLQQMLDDDNIKAILFGRGGYGLSRIIDKIDFTKFVQQPKWLIGYSDITVILNHVFNQFNIAGLHSPMAGAFNDCGFNNEYILSIRNILQGNASIYQCSPYQLNKTGEADGILTGGNLAILSHLVGSPSAVDTAGKILFIEDIGEYLYSTDRMLVQLKRSGQLAHLKALVVGQFSDMKDTVIPFGKSIETIIYEAVKEYHYPVCFNFPVGHVTQNYPLKIGVETRLVISNDKVQLTQ
jgi:muramoyltetrapeptide carboxypeptidase